MLLDLCGVMILPSFNRVHWGHRHNVLTYSEKESQIQGLSMSQCLCAVCPVTKIWHTGLSSRRQQGKGKGKETERNE